MKKFYSIGEISKIYHIGLDSIRYYEKIGLIHPKRGENNYRYYANDEIYRLNIIRELLDLGFSTKDILNYFNNHNIKTTYELLIEEKNKIDSKINKLKQLKNNVDNRIEEIRDINRIEFMKVQEKHFDNRKYFILNVGYTNDSDMDILIQQLSDKEKDRFYIIGNNQIGTVIPKGEYLVENEVTYQSVFVISKNGDNILSKGKYLSILYNGDYKLTKKCIDDLISYASEKNYKIVSNFLEIIWIDIHSTNLKNEYVTEVQVRVE